MRRRGLTYDEWLVRRASAELRRDGVISTPLVRELERAGFDVPALERQLSDELAREGSFEDEEETV